MTPKLKPLLLPRKVEEERLEEQRQRQKLEQQEQNQQEEQQQHQQQQQQWMDHDQGHQQVTQQSLEPTPSSLKSQRQQAAGDGDMSCLYDTQNSSSSDLAYPSPVTPTFYRSGHGRFSGSSSSLEILSSSCSESPASPTQSSYPAPKQAKRQLPDVKEEPLEKEGDEIVHLPTLPAGMTALVSKHHFYSQPYSFSSYLTRPRGLAFSCQYCTANISSPRSSGNYPCGHSDVDIDYYDIGFLSDGDVNSSLRSNKKRRADSEAPLFTWGSRVGTRFSSLTRWKTTNRRVKPSFYPASEPSLDSRQPLSRAPSSRSSSISASARRAPDWPAEPPLPQPPGLSSPSALSPYGSVESLHRADDNEDVDVDLAHVRMSIERDRAMATTPLLPPLMTETQMSSRVASLQASPLLSPAVVESPSAEMPSPLPTVSSSPTISAKPSLSSFRPLVSPVPLATHTAATAPTTPDMPSPLALLPLAIFEKQDEWSDRLGHANFSIVPRPYAPEEASMEVLRNFRADWDLAKVNYMRHLVRTGEHYGTTSKTYALTEAKWAETERQWHLAQTDLVDRVSRMSSDAAFATLHWHLPQEDVSPALVPKMLDAEKFPARGDEDIVGPMARDAVMARDSADDKRNPGTTQFWRSLAEKLGRRW